MVPIQGDTHLTTRIYDPNNVPFDVTEARAADLVLNKGWTRQRTTTVAIDSLTDDTPTAEDDWRLNPVAREAESDLDDTPDDDTPTASFESDEAVETPRTSRRRQK